MIDDLVPPMAERIVAQRLRESVQQHGGIIHKEMQSFRADLALLRQGAQAALCFMPLLCYTLAMIALPYSLVHCDIYHFGLCHVHL